jgi:hypothetical protein
VSDSRVFEWLSEQLELRTSLSRLEARGTIRLVLKEAGLDAATVTPAQLGVVVTRLLPDALQKRRVNDASGLCDRLLEALRAYASEMPAPVQETAYDVFERIGRDPTRERKR